MKGGCPFALLKSAIAVRKMSIFQLRLSSNVRPGAVTASLLTVQPFSSMFSTSQPPVIIASELPLVSAEPASREADVAAGSLKIIPCLLALFTLLGIALAFWLRSVPGGNPDPRLTYNVFYFLFARHEPAGLLIVALFNLATAFLLFRKKIRAGNIFGKNADCAGRICVAIALIAFVIAAIGAQTVFHNYLLTADENLADFQAKIFLNGKIQAQLPLKWINAAYNIRSTYIDYFPATHSWNANYLPVYAAMRAAFQSIGLPSLLNPILAAVTIFALYCTTRNIWPESKTNALVAIGLLGSSSQFLLMSMTAYAMPAHLALNTIWLWLYSRPDRRVFYLAPFVGVLAVGLHQPIVHALFVLPFVARLVWQRRWRPVLIFGAIYIAGCVGWYVWKMYFQPPPVPGDDGSIFRLANPRMAVIQPMNLLLIIGWASLATPLLTLLGLRRVSKAPPIVQDAMLSCILTFGFYYFFYLDQAHGWGYRYFHGVLACFVIVAVAGFNRLSVLVGLGRALTFVVSGITMSILIQLPLRCIQVEKFVRPYARTAAVLHAMPTDMVALRPHDAWYAADLIRNDPFLEQRPVIVSLYGLTPAAASALEKNGSVRIVTRDDLTRLGMFTARPEHYGRDPFQLGCGR
jgi:hypothetical protein